MRQAFAEEAVSCGLTQSTLGSKIGVGRSVISRRLKGHTNITLETLADMTWALGREVDVVISKPSARGSNGSTAVAEVPPSAPGVLSSGGELSQDGPATSDESNNAFQKELVSA